MSIACYGGPDARKCDGYGILPFELHNGCVVMLCRLHHYQYSINEPQIGDSEHEEEEGEEKIA